MFPCCHIQLDNVARYTSPLRVLHCPPVDITGKVVLQFQAVFFFFYVAGLVGKGISPTRADKLWSDMQQEETRGEEARLYRMDLNVYMLTKYSP